MKKRTAFIGAILSLIPFGQPLLIKTGVVLSTTGLVISFPEKVSARNSDYYFDRAYEKAKNGDHYGAISDYTKAIELDPKDDHSYHNRGVARENLGKCYEAISDYIKAIEDNLGIKANKELLPLQPGDVPATFSDCSSLENFINYKPNTSIEDGIRKFISWYRKFYGK